MVISPPKTVDDGFAVTVTAEVFCRLFVTPDSVPLPLISPLPSKVPLPLIVPLLTSVAPSGTVRVVSSGTVRLVPLGIFNAAPLGIVMSQGSSRLP